MIPILIAILGGLGAMFIILSLRRPSTAVIRDRLESISPGQQRQAPRRALEELELSRPFRDRVLKPLLTSISRITSRISPGTTMEKTDQRLAQAGYPRGLNLEGFYGLKGLAAVITTVILALGMYFNVLPGFLPSWSNAPISAFQWALGGLVIGFFLPDLWIYDKRKKRQKQIGKALPDVVDIIAISVEAGLGFDAAVQRVATKTRDELSVEFERYLVELRLGKSRRESLRNIIWRTGVADLSQFITAIIQADMLGVSIANVLRIQSEQMRMRRRQRAEELAQKAPIKMLFPMALFIFPSIFVVILGPIVPAIMTGLGGK